MRMQVRKSAMKLGERAMISCALHPSGGVGQGQFTKHHYLTAHNTFVLVMTEVGFVGLFLFSMLIWICLKTPLTALSRYRHRPDARVAEVWSVSLLAAFAAIFSGSAFLSFAYHYIIWIFMGLSAALYVSIKRHDPEFEVRVGFLDMVGVALANVLLFGLIHVFLRLKGF